MKLNSADICMTVFLKSVHSDLSMLTLPSNSSRLFPAFHSDLCLRLT